MRRTRRLILLPYCLPTAERLRCPFVQTPTIIEGRAAFLFLLSHQVLCSVIWVFVNRLSQEAFQRRSQRDRLMKIKVFKLRREADDIPCNITLQSAGGVSFQSAGIARRA